MSVALPLVSIVIPAYQPGPIFRDTLDSCLRQDWPNLEVVVSLDGDDEFVRAAVRDAEDPRVRLVGDGRRLGQFGNFNRAVDESRGEFIKLLSADDLLARHAIRRMVSAMLEHPEIGLCAAQMYVFWSGKDGALVPRLTVPLPASRPLRVFGAKSGRWLTAWHGNQIGGPSNVMIRRCEWWRTGGFDPRMDHCGDQGLWYRLVAQSGLLLLDQPLIAYRMHENSVTGRGALTFARVEQPFMVAESATLGASIANEAWWERQVRTFQTVNSTAGHAAASFRRSPTQGWRAIWCVIAAGGLPLVPFTAALAFWAVLRSNVLRLRSFWPFRDITAVEQRTMPGLDLDLLRSYLDDESAYARPRSDATRT